MSNPDLRAALEAVRDTLRRENDKPGGPIRDTIWHTPHETLFDFIDGALSTEAAAMAATVPAEPIALDHIACIEDGELRFMSGRKAPAYDCELYAMPDGKNAPPLFAQAPVAGQPAEPSPADDGGTPGPWFVRTREKNGKVLGCFVAAPDCQGMAYDAEILGDDEYRDTDEDEDAGIKRRLADCHLIVAAVNAHRLALKGDSNAR